MLKFYLMLISYDILDPVQETLKSICRKHKIVVKEIVTVFSKIRAISLQC